MDERHEEVPAVVYVLGFVVGAISAMAVASDWLNQSPAPLAAVLGGLGGMGGVEQRENIFRAIRLALYYAALIWIYIALEPVIRDEVVRNIAIPTVVGGFAGMLAFNLWKAFVR